MSQSRRGALTNDATSGSPFDAFLQRAKITAHKDFDLSRLSFMKAGGRCRYFVLPRTIVELTELISYLQRNAIKFKVIGKLSNVLFRDGVINTVMISTAKLNHHGFLGDDVYEAGAGMSLPKMARHL